MRFIDYLEIFVIVLTVCLIFWGAGLYILYDYFSLHPFIYSVYTTFFCVFGLIIEIILIKIHD